VPTALRIFLESKEAFGVSEAGHLYLVLREVIVDNNGNIIGNVYNPDLDRTIGGVSGSSGALRTAEALLADSSDGYSAGVTTADRHSQDITAWLGLPNITGEVNDAVQSAWNALGSAINALNNKYGYELPLDFEIDHLANSNAALLTVLESAFVTLSLPRRPIFLSEYQVLTITERRSWLQEM
jgi:hypothetical protein